MKKIFFILMVIISSIAYYNVIFSQQLEITDEEALQLGLKKPKTITEANELMQTAYKECMKAIEDFSNGLITSYESDKKLKTYIYYKKQYDILLKSTSNNLNNNFQNTQENSLQNVTSNNDPSLNNGNNSQNRNVQNERRNTQNNGRIIEENPLPHSEFVNEDVFKNKNESKNIFSSIIDFFLELFNLDNKTKLLNVPLRTQLDPENGDKGSLYCAPTCLAMVLEYYGVKLSTKEVAKLCNTDVKGTTYSEDMLNAAYKLGFKQSFAGANANIDWLKQITNSGTPVIVYVDTKSYGMANGHCMVVVGVKNGYVYVNDPWTGKQLRYGTAAFNAIWTTRSYYAVVIKK